MVSMMVRKGTPPNLVPEPPPEEETKSLDGNETVVGSAAAGKGNLEGIELDEETVKAQQMVEQVQVMVQTNPEAAANLVKRWLNR
jgi:flagellar biosynthesis/type III secretory pathway M-ring protein FliF/YscJ